MRAEALMWLNDRLGEPFSAEISVAVGDLDWAVMTASGELQHHRTADESEGVYTVGGADIDLTELPQHVARADDRRTGDRSRRGRPDGARARGRDRMTGQPRLLPGRGVGRVPDRPRRHARAGPPSSSGATTGEPKSGFKVARVASKWRLVRSRWGWTRGWPRTAVSALRPGSSRSCGRSGPAPTSPTETGCRLGKPTLYQLSYVRVRPERGF
jgi:hypothetical protein